ncbi:hypothetical protein HDU89_001417 [Geranomyces variabilis]|nr:hypothetical protein HDU89_001417 [Geranomyces variabilis]
MIVRGVVYGRHPLKEALAVFAPDHDTLSAVDFKQLVRAHLGGDAAQSFTLYRFAKGPLRSDDGALVAAAGGVQGDDGHPGNHARASPIGAANDILDLVRIDTDDHVPLREIFPELADQHARPVDDTRALQPVSGDSVHFLVEFDRPIEAFVAAAHTLSVPHSSAYVARSAFTATAFGDLPAYETVVRDAGDTSTPVTHVPTNEVAAKRFTRKRMLLAAVIAAVIIIAILSITIGLKSHHTSESAPATSTSQPPATTAAPAASPTAVATAGELVRTFTHPAGTNITEIAVSPDGKILFAGAELGLVTWFMNGTVRRTYPDIPQPDSFCFGMSPDQILMRRPMPLRSGYAIYSLDLTTDFSTSVLGDMFTYLMNGPYLYTRFNHGASFFNKYLLSDLVASDVGVALARYNYTDIPSTNGDEITISSDGSLLGFRHPVINGSLPLRGGWSDASERFSTFSGDRDRLFFSGVVVEDASPVAFVGEWAEAAFSPKAGSNRTFVRFRNTIYADGEKSSHTDGFATPLVHVPPPLLFSNASNLLPTAAHLFSELTDPSDHGRAIRNRDNHPPRTPGNRTIGQWDAVTGAPLGQFVVDGPVTHLTASPDGKWLMAAVGSKIYQWAVYGFTYS